MRVLPSPTRTDDDCASCREAIAAVVAGDADCLTAALVDAHVAGCASCRGALATARAYRRMMRRLGDSTRAPSALRGRVTEILRGARGSRTP